MTAAVSGAEFELTPTERAVKTVGILRSLGFTYDERPENLKVLAAWVRVQLLFWAPQAIVPDAGFVEAACGSLDVISQDDLEALEIRALNALGDEAFEALDSRSRVIARMIFDSEVGWRQAYLLRFTQ